jgi:hypothetical protein
MPNAKPTGAWLVPGSTFVVDDGDGEQVLGTIECSGMMPVKVPRSGAHTVPAGAQRPCKLTLFDGQDLVTTILP